MEQQAEIDRFLAMPPPKGWQPQQWRALVQGWFSGRPTGLIGFECGKGKNAAVGAAHRRGLPARRNPIELARAGAASRAPRGSGVPKPPKLTAAPRGLNVAVAVANARRAGHAEPVRKRAPVPLRPIGTIPRDPRGCRFPMWPDKGPAPLLAEDQRFCCEAQAPGSAYCAAHHAKCFTGTVVTMDGRKRAA